jgi:hypothetical protein
MVDHLNEGNSQSEIDRLIIYDNHHWTDSTSLIRIVATSSVGGEGKFFSSYRGYKVYMRQISLNPEEKNDKSRTVPTSLFWKKNKMTENKREIEDVLAKSFLEIQYEYDFQEECLVDVILKPIKLGDRVELTCGKCSD